MPAHDQWGMFNQEHSISRHAIAGCHVALEPKTCVREVCIDTPLFSDIYPSAVRFVNNLPAIHVVTSLTYITTGVAISWEALFLYDIILFCLTIYKTWRVGRRPGENGIPLISLILRDGQFSTSSVSCALCLTRQTDLGTLTLLLGAMYFG